MRFNNSIMLISYADSLGKNLGELADILKEDFKGAVGGLHILPFFPSSADRGFAPLRYDEVDPALGDWEDIRKLACSYYLMFDFMINHISRKSQYYLDMVRNMENSKYWKMFLYYTDFWPGGAPSEDELALVYKRKPRAPYIEVTLADGRLEKLWCTFSEEQVDLDVDSEETQAFIRDTIRGLAAKGMNLLRLDAFAYAVKRPGTNCFFVEPQIWELLSFTQEIADKEEVVLLPEIHEHYSFSMKLAEKGYWVYDFALPMLCLYTLYTGDSEPLKRWLAICPKKQFTTLDTHDGIGVVDVKDLLSDEQTERTRDLLYQRGANVKRVYSTEKYNNLDIYQINCTYYSALGDDDRAYLLARAIQFFAPGIPQVYYVGLLAGKNDLDLVQKTMQGRDINRHSYTIEEVKEEVKRPVVRDLMRMMRFRNDCPAFAGELTVDSTDAQTLVLLRAHGEVQARLWADCADHTFRVEHKKGDGPWELVLAR